MNIFHPLTNQDSFCISPCTKEDIIEIISNLKSNKSVRPSGITTKILRLIKDDISEHLSLILNAPLATGIFPEKLKVSKVISIYKKDSKIEFYNYRSTSLLSNIDKILEKLMYNRLMKFLTEEKILYLKQLGFKKTFSAPYTIINLIYSSENAIYFKKAFETVDGEILLKRSFRYGIRGIAND